MVPEEGFTGPRLETSTCLPNTGPGRAGRSACGAPRRSPCVSGVLLQACRGTHVCTHTHTHTHTRVHTHRHTQAHTRMHAHICARTHAHTHTRIRSSWCCCWKKWEKEETQLDTSPVHCDYSKQLSWEGYKSKTQMPAKDSKKARTGL